MVKIVMDELTELMGGQTAETLFHLASVVKTMTSTAIMQLREAGKLELDDPIVKHLPYFRVDDPRSDQITIRHCLCHTSGIGHPEDYSWDNPEFDDEALERHVRGLATFDQAVPFHRRMVPFCPTAQVSLGPLPQRPLRWFVGPVVTRVHAVVLPLRMRPDTPTAVRSPEVSPGERPDEAPPIDPGVEHPDDPRPHDQSN